MTTTIITNDSNDTLKTTDLSETITSNGGNDLITAKGGDDIVSAGNGDDVVRAGEGNDIVDGGAGADYLIGGSGNDVIQGGEGDDILRGEFDDDLLFGDEFDGFTFTEIASFRWELNRLREVVSLDGTVLSSDKSQQNGEVQYNNIVTIEAEDSTDSIHVFEVDDTFIDAGEGLGIDDGDDTISTQKRIDGDEKLAVIINEDPRFDAANAFSFTLDNFSGLLSTSSIKVELFLDGLAVGDLTFDGTTLASGDNGSTVTINNSADVPVFDSLLLSAGDATTSFSLRGFSLQLGLVTPLLSGNGNDDIQGAEGGDEIYGGLGNDIITGGLGDDILVGGANRDTLTGGSGRDTFVFVADDILDPGDTITDFQIGIDKLDVTQLLSVAEGFSVADNAFTTGHLGVSTTSNGFTLSFDFDGTAGSVSSPVVLAEVAVAYGSLSSLDATYLKDTLLVA